MKAKARNDLQPLPQRPKWLLPLLLMITVAVVFGGLASAEFSSLDDPFNIWQNARIAHPSLSGVAYYWAHPEYGLYIPITYTVWSVLATISQVSPDPHGVGLNPWVYHAANVGIHLLSTLAVFAILDELFQHRRAAFFGALLFALHPVQVEPVAWAAGTKDVLCGMFSLVAIWQYILFARRGTSLRYALATTALVLAMLSKPSAMVVPVIALAIDCFLIHRPLRQIGRAIAPWLVLSIACAIVAKLAQPATGVPQAPLWTRPFIAADALTFYLYKLVWPMALALDYGHRPEVVLGQWWFKFTWIPSVAVGIALWLGRKRWPALLVAGIVFVVAVAPVLGFVTFLFQYFSTTADHYLYLAMLGPAIAVAWLIHGNDRRPAVVVAVSIIIGLFGLRSMLQTRVWQSDVTLFPATLEVNPSSVIALNNLGHALQVDNRLDEAGQKFRRAAELHPNYPDAMVNLAFILEQQNQMAEAITWRRRAIELMLKRPPEIRGNVAVQYALIAQDEIDLKRLDAAKQTLLEGMKRYPADPDLQRLIDSLNQKIRESPATTQTGQAQ